MEVVPLDSALAADLVTYAARLVRAMRRDAKLPAEIRVLSILDERGPTGISALAQADACSQPTMSDRVNQLAERGAVDKAPNPADGRSSVVELTPAGRETLTRARSATADVVAERLAATDHTPDDLVTTVAVLKHLVEAPSLVTTPSAEPEESK